jgi:predicted phage terminase large subunit-like protein
MKGKNSARPLSAPRDPKAALLELDKFESEESLKGFIKAAWHVVEPGRPFGDGWHIDAVCEHLEAVTDGHIDRLLINIPPGFMKSLTTNVLWPAWEWGPKNKPHNRYVSGAYSETLTVRDNRRTRMLIRDEWYQKLWGDRFSIMADQDSKIKFENNKKGFKLATSVRGVGTGERGDRVIVDDPHNVKDGESDAYREEAVSWFTEVLPTRMSDPEKSAIVVIMQRIHENDVSGHIIANDLGYTHLMLPMEFEAERRCHTLIGFKDPRIEDGELLWPGRFTKRVVERDKKVMGSYAVAGQFQQRPTPRGGGMFQREWFKKVQVAPPGGKIIRAWDLAATEASKARSGTAYTVGLKMKMVDDDYYIMDVRRGRWGENQVETEILDCGKEDGYRVRISLPQDPGQAGKVQAKRFIKLLKGFDVHTSLESGSKEVRATGLSAQAEAGNVYLVNGFWNEAFLNEICSFPMSSIKDQVDAASRAFGELIGLEERNDESAPPEAVEPQDEEDDYGLEPIY